MRSSVKRASGLHENMPIVSEMWGRSQAHCRCCGCGRDPTSVVQTKVQRRGIWNCVSNSSTRTVISHLAATMYIASTVVRHCAFDRRPCLCFDLRLSSFLFFALLPRLLVLLRVLVSISDRRQGWQRLWVSIQVKRGGRSRSCRPLTPPNYPGTLSCHFYAFSLYSPHNCTTPVGTSCCLPMMIPILPCRRLLAVASLFPARRSTPNKCARVSIITAACNPRQRAPRPGRVAPRQKIQGSL